MAATEKVHIIGIGDDGLQGVSAAARQLVAEADLPDPDSIFVGGVGRSVSNVIDLAYDCLKVGGRLVANVGSIENLATVHEILHGKAKM